MIFRVGVLAVVALALTTTAEADTKAYSKAVQQNCNEDYKTYCGE